MNTIDNEPVVEQALDNETSKVSEKSIEKSPTTSNYIVEKEIVADKKADIDYLDPSLFSNVKEISVDELSEPEVVNEDFPNQEKYLSTFSDISEREIITGRVIGINEKEILIDIGFKSEGIINRDEFSSDELPDVGGKIDVYLERMEDESGKTVISNFLAGQSDSLEVNGLEATEGVRGSAAGRRVRKRARKRVTKIPA